LSSASTLASPVGRGTCRARGKRARKRIQFLLRRGGSLSVLRAGVLQLAAQGHETAMRGKLEDASAQAAEAAAAAKPALDAPRRRARAPLRACLRRG